jgi:hypothetical protein
MTADRIDQLEEIGFVWDAQFFMYHTNYTHNKLYATNQRNGGIFLTIISF